MLIMLRTACSSFPRSAAPLSFATRWMLASVNPEATMPPVLTAAVAMAQTPYSAAPSLCRTTGAASSMPKGYAA